MCVAVEAFALFGILFRLDVRSVSFRVEDGRADSVLSYSDTIEWTTEVLLGSYLCSLSV